MVLAGGRSSRFGGDKALALHAGRTLIDHAIAALRPIADEVVIAGRVHDGFRSLWDRPGPGLGPLAGLNAALAEAAAGSFDGVVSVPCDAPQLSGEILATLLEEPWRAAAFAGLPVCGYWPASLAAALDSQLSRGDDRSLRRWIACCDARIVPGPDVANINTQADLLALDALVPRVQNTID